MCVPGYEWVPACARRFTSPSIFEMSGAFESGFSWMMPGRFASQKKLYPAAKINTAQEMRTTPSALIKDSHWQELEQARSTSLWLLGRPGRFSGRR